MNTPQILLLFLCGAVFILIAILATVGNLYSLKGIPNKPVGNGQHGTARFATKGEVAKTYKHIPYTPQLWRKGEHLPSVDELKSMPKGNFIVVKTGAFSAQRIMRLSYENKTQAVLQVGYSV